MRARYKYDVGTITLMFAFLVNKQLYNAPETDESCKTPIKRIGNVPCLLREAPTPKRLVVMFHGNESSLDELHAIGDGFVVATLRDAAFARVSQSVMRNARGAPS